MPKRSHFGKIYFASYLFCTVHISLKLLFLAALSGYHLSSLYSLVSIECTFSASLLSSPYHLHKIAGN